MSDDTFKAVYLKEIGVHTPISHLNEAVASPEMSEMATSAEHMTLAALEKEVSTCTACALAKGRKNTVFGVGSAQTELVFIGEAPGQREDELGEPFVGKAGKLLDSMLAAIAFNRQQVYIMNTVKCRPPNNRDPQLEEVEACGRWFDMQLQLLTPKIICLLGRVAAQTVLKTDAPLSQLRGRWHAYHGIPVWVAYHPAFLLRSPQQKHKAWQDLQVIKEALNKSG